MAIAFSETDSAGLRLQPPCDLGGFQLLSQIGSGGMGTVYKARQKSLDRLVAVKVLSPSVSTDLSFIERFVREARTSAKLDHLNIVTGIDIGRDRKLGLYYFVMEYVDGPSLRQLLAEHPCIAEGQALKIGVDIAAALSCAEKANIVHRDIKPENILLTTHGVAKLADLGLAKQTHDQKANLTMEGTTVGTPSYMAPEQIRGGNLDTRSDIYALGATLYHMLAGHPPFQGSSPTDIMAKHLTEEAPPLRSHARGISEPTCRLIGQMLQKDPAQRPQTAVELLLTLQLLFEKHKGSSPHNHAPNGNRPPAGHSGTHSGVHSHPRRRRVVRQAASLVKGLGVAGEFVCECAQDLALAGRTVTSDVFKWWREVVSVRAPAAPDHKRAAAPPPGPPR